MKRTLIFALLAVALLAGMPRSTGAADTVNVVTTHATLRSLVETIGGDRVKVDNIIKPNQDPHYASAKPSFMVQARRADLWVRVGMEMEIGYERLILEGSRNRNIQVGNPGHLDASTNVMRLEVPTSKIDRSMGDVHPQGNPHYWLDPYNVRIIAGDIAERLGRIDPAGYETFNKNLEAFKDRLDRAMFGAAAVDKIDGDALWHADLNGSIDSLLQQNSVKAGGWYAAMKPHEGKAIVTYHKSWIYFAHRFGLEIPMEIEPKPGIPPGPGHTLQVINTIKGRKIPVIVVEPYYNRGAADSIGQKTGAAVLVLANAVGGCENGCDDYIKMIDNVVKKLSSEL